MTQQDLIQAVENQLIDFLAERPDLFLVQVKADAKNNIKVFLDGDAGVNIDICARANRQLYRFIEESGLVKNGDFSLEVSSPGLDEPLKLHRQYVKNTGRQLELILADESKLQGTLTAVQDTGITLEEKKGKGRKQETIVHHLPFGGIKTAKVTISF